MEKRSSINDMHSLFYSLRLLHTACRALVSCEYVGFLILLSLNMLNKGVGIDVAPVSRRLALLRVTR